MAAVQLGVTVGASLPERGRPSSFSKVTSSPLPVCPRNVARGTDLSRAAMLLGCGTLASTLVLSEVCWVALSRRRSSRKSKQARRFAGTVLNSATRRDLSSLCLVTACRAAEADFRFGAIADVQYADMDDGYNFTKTRVRRYRQSLQLWQQAIDWFRTEKVDFIAQLGDLVDGANCDLKEGGKLALRDLWQSLDASSPPVLNLIGNHELYNFSRTEMESGIQVPGAETPFRVSADPRLRASTKQRAYYSFSPHPAWRVIVLDPYDFSILSRGGGRPGKELGMQDLSKEALDLCQAQNPNDVMKDGFARGIAAGPDLRWVPLNGAVGSSQLVWLRETLADAHQAEQNTVVFSHVVLHPEGTPQGDSHCLCLLWNYEDVLDCLRKAASPPVAVFCGHTHRGAQYRDEHSGTHHITLASPLEVTPGSDACGVVEAFSDGSLTLRGRGAVPSLLLRRGEDAVALQA